MQPLPIGTAVPDKVRRATLRLGADLGASLVSIGDLDRALNAPISGMSPASEGPPRMAVNLSSRDVNNGLMKTKSPHHNPMEEEFDFI